jgi:bacterioferritin (cytochrome b1)
MKAPNKKIIENLQTAAQMTSHLAGQFKVDCHQLRAMGLDWLANKFSKWKKESCKFNGQFLDRLLYFDTDPDYDIGSVAGADTISEILDRAGELVNAALDQFKQFRKDAWDAEADYTPDIYEHAIGCLEKQAYKIEREQELVKKLTEPAYVGARLEDA